MSKQDRCYVFDLTTEEGRRANDEHAAQVLASGRPVVCIMIETHKETGVPRVLLEFDKDVYAFTPRDFRSLCSAMQASLKEMEDQLKGGK